MTMLTRNGYEMEEVVVGYLTPMLVLAIHMPRQQFLEILERLLDWYEDDDLPKDELRETARTMPRFPLGDWKHWKRGCGCLVGEYLIAAKHLDRGGANIIRELGRLPHGRDLEALGEDIDVELRREVGVSYEDEDPPFDRYDLGDSVVIVFDDPTDQNQEAA